MSVIENTVIKIHDDSMGGMYRIVCCPSGHDVVFLYQIEVDAKPLSIPSLQNKEKLESKNKKLLPISATELETMLKSGTASQIEIEPEFQLLLDKDALSENEKRIFERRIQLSEAFLDHERVSTALTSKRGIGKLIAEIRSNYKCARASLYNYWELFCRFGFDERSLNPRLDRCGAPGVLRPCNELRKKAGRKPNKVKLGIIEAFPQVGVTEEMRNKVLLGYKRLRDPKLKFSNFYTQLISNYFTTQYKETPKGPLPVTPTQGTIPNKRQVRHIIEKEFGPLELIKAKTTDGHYDRNHRPMTGKAWEGSPGPGHIYAVDATIGDIYIRSSINRSWYIGRPIVYIVVDVWSTAIVGFYVGLTGPSWDAAKLALFSATISPDDFRRLWKLQPFKTLNPCPMSPHSFMADRGEWVSQGARTTFKALGINLLINPSYRPDLKGLVEVLHRITKDRQYQFVPGAIDARRQEIELKSKPSDSIFTIQEYVQYLTLEFERYNFFADRGNRLTSEMIAANVAPTPAGLWEFGHESRLGYRKYHSYSKLVTTYLPHQDSVIRRDGIYFNKLLYQSKDPAHKDWTGIARNYGNFVKKAYYFPGNTARIWWTNRHQRGVQRLNLSHNARALPGTTFDEWEDATAYQQTKTADLEHLRLDGDMQYAAKRDQLIAQAGGLTALADQNRTGPVPLSRDARAAEKSLDNLGSPQQNDHSAHSDESVASSSLLDSQQAYQNLMDEIFTSDANEKGEGQ